MPLTEQSQQAQSNLILTILTHGQPAHDDPTIYIYIYWSCERPFKRGQGTNDLFRPLPEGRGHWQGTGVDLDGI